jgi:hypothetical protein
VLSCALALALIVPVSCGNDSGSGTKAQRLSAAEETIVSRSETSLRGYCEELALYLSGKRGSPTASDTGQVEDGLDRLIAVARKKPEAPARTGESMRQVLGDLAEDLEGSNCSGAFQQKLEQGLATLPPEK